MINLLDIKKAVADMIQRAGGNVIANEVAEGFKKPAYFISPFPASVELQNEYLEDDSITIQIRYHPKKETEEECILVAQRLKKLFFGNQIQVKDREITVQNMDFETENKVLYVSFTLDFCQETDITPEEYQEMKILQIGGI